MCGIAGIIISKQLKGEEEKKSLLKHTIQQMNNALQHRGPDGEGVWINTDATVALGHRRLSIIDLSNAGYQPMHYAHHPAAIMNKDENGYTIVHNGEIYNYIELRQELTKKGYHFHSQTDTEIILAAYDCWGNECVNHFDGMFAFAIWDEKKQQLFAARDRFGEKPFFYFFNGEKFLFASEMKALWAAGAERIPNQKMLFNFITIGYTDNPELPDETFYENIFKLPAACVLHYSIAENDFSINNYWSIDPEFQHKKINTAEALEQFSHLFTTSVNRRLRSDVAAGTSLSGGLDSSSIVSTIAGLQKNSSFTAGLKDVFTAIFPGFEKDEMIYSKQVADTFGLQQHTVSVSAEAMIDDWNKLSYYQEEPFGSASVYAQYKVFELASQQGIKVLLDGQGADETLAGYHKYYKWFWQELYRRKKLSRSKELEAAKAIGIQETFTYKNKIAAYFPDFATVVLEQQYLLKALQHKDLTKDFVHLQSKEAYYTTPEIFTLNGVLHFNTFTHGLEELLRYADRNSMAHGREVRLPFLSHELVEFIFSLPATFKIRNGWTKWLLRETMKNKLPDSIVWRKDKVGFEPPQQNWMQHKQLQEMIWEAKKKLVAEKILNPAVLNNKTEPLAAHATDNYDWRYFSAATLFK